MQVDHIVILDAHHTVAVGFCKGTHLCGACTLILVDQELGAVAVLDVLHLHQVVGEHALAGVLGGELCLVGSSLAACHDAFAMEHLAHALKDNHDALTAGIHNAGLLQNRQQVGGVLQSLLAGGHHHIPQSGHILGTAGSSFLRGNACNREDGALGGLHNGLISALDTLLQSLDNVGSGGFLLAFQRLGEAAEQQAGDNTGVAACAAQHGGSSGLGSLTHGAAVVQCFQLAHRSTHGHAHVGASVAIRNRENVQLVHAGALIVDVVGARDNGVTQNLTRNHSFLLLVLAGKARRIRMNQQKSGDHIVYRNHNAGNLQAGSLLYLVLDAVRDAACGSRNVQAIAHCNVQFDHQTTILLRDTDTLFRVIRTVHHASDGIGHITGCHCGNTVTLFGCFTYQSSKIPGRKADIPQRETGSDHSRSAPLCYFHKTHSRSGAQRRTDTHTAPRNTHIIIQLWGALVQRKMLVYQLFAQVSALTAWFGRLRTGKVIA